MNQAYNEDNKRKILFVRWNTGNVMSGGEQCTKRNYKSLCKVVGEENVINYPVRPWAQAKGLITILKRVVSIAFGNWSIPDRIYTNKLIEEIKRGDYTDIWLDSSLFGVYAKIIRKNYPSMRIYTFFHNIELEFAQDSIKGRPLKNYFVWMVKWNEKCSTKFSNKIICLNERDSDAVSKHYGRYSDIIIPITLDGEPASCVEDVQNTNKEAVFLGSNFFGNTQGLKWFCESVLPHTNIHLTIVGSGMDRFASQIPQMISKGKVSIYSSVEDVKPYLDAADFVILPIISGSGMKVKTAEVLKNGKFVLGTSEAFRGYEINKKVGLTCDTAEEFLSAISNLRLLTKFNEPSVRLFEEKYSFNASLPLFRNILSI